MRANEVRPCDLCGEGLCASGAITFHRVRFERFIIDHEAIRERVGLHLMFQNKASSELVEVFSTREDVAVPITEPAELLVCEGCAILQHECLGQMAETAHVKREERMAAARAALEGKGE